MLVCNSLHYGIEWTYYKSSLSTISFIQPVRTCVPCMQQHRADGYYALDVKRQPSKTDFKKCSGMRSLVQTQRWAVTLDAVRSLVLMSH